MADFLRTSQITTIDWPLLKCWFSSLPTIKTRLHPTFGRLCIEILPLYSTMLKGMQPVCLPAQNPPGRKSSQHRILPDKILLVHLPTGTKSSRNNKHTKSSWYKILAENFVCLSLREDILPGGKCPGRILCVYYCRRILYIPGGFCLGGICPGSMLPREDFVCFMSGRICPLEDFVPGGKSATSV